MSRIGKRIEPPEGIETKVGDRVTWEVVYDDGSIGTITTIVDEFDVACKIDKKQFIIEEL